MARKKKTGKGPKKAKKLVKKTKIVSKPKADKVAQVVKPKVKTQPKAVTAKPTAKPKVKKSSAKRLEDKDLSKKYKHYIPGSVAYDAEKKRQRCKIQCIDCDAKREICTSDLHQVKRCLTCTKGFRKKNRKKKPASK